MAFRWLWFGLVVVLAIARPSVATEPCTDMWSAQNPLIEVSKIARVFRDGIDKTYIEYTRADFKSKIDDLAASRVFAVQSFLTNRLEAVQTNAWQAFEILSETSDIKPRQLAVRVAEYLTSKITSDLAMIEQYEHHNGNLFDGVSNLARSQVLAQPHSEIGRQYGVHFAQLLQGLKQEVGSATQHLGQLKQCLE